MNEQTGVDPGEGAGRSAEDLALEVERLRREPDGGRLAEALREIMLTSAEVGAIGARSRHGDLLRSVIETAAKVLDCERGSLFLVEPSSGELVFQVAIGPEAEQLRERRIPAGHGIVGYVAATGQSMAVSKAADDPRLARDVGDAIGYRPSTVLCVPLSMQDRVEGVLEMLDKAGGAPFTQRDIETLERFGQLAAIAIDQSRLMADVHLLFRSLVGDLARGGPSVDPAHRLAYLSAESISHGDDLRLARLAHDVSRHGEDARRLAIEMLGALDHYLAEREQQS